MNKTYKHFRSWFHLESRYYYYSIPYMSKSMWSKLQSPSNDKNTVEQKTEFKDTKLRVIKNKDKTIKKEYYAPIYAGDLIKCTDPRTNTVMIFEVVYNEDYSAYMAWRYEDTSKCFQLTCDSVLNYRVEVIGTMLKNSELYV